MTVSLTIPMASSFNTSLENVPHHQHQCSKVQYWVEGSSVGLLITSHASSFALPLQLLSSSHVSHTSFADHRSGDTLETLERLYFPQPPVVVAAAPGVKDRWGKRKEMKGWWENKARDRIETREKRRKCWSVSSSTLLLLLVFNW